MPRSKLVAACAFVAAMGASYELSFASATRLSPRFQSANPRRLNLWGHHRGSYGKAVSSRSLQAVLRRAVAKADPEPEEAASTVRRTLLSLVGVVAAGTAVDTYLRESDERYVSAGNILAPAPYKETLRTELIPGIMWGFEQCLALGSVSSNIRMTVVRLKDGTLWVSGPIAPTRQCYRLLDELGKVSHIVAPSLALEHRVSLGEFAARYPQASLWVTPGLLQQDGILFPPPGQSKTLGQGSPPPWADELDCKIFYVAPPVTDAYAEAAFFHRSSKTLLLSDAVLKLPTTAPKVLESYGFDGTPGPLSAEEWRFKALAFDFVTMRGQDDADFAALTRPAGIVNPLLRFIVYRRCPREASEWVADVARWPFEQVVPAHLAAPFDCSPSQFLDAFGFLFGKPSSWEPEDEQLGALRGLRDIVGGPEF